MDPRKVSSANKWKSYDRALQYWVVKMYVINHTHYDTEISRNAISPFGSVLVIYILIFKLNFLGRGLPFKYGKLENYPLAGANKYYSLIKTSQNLNFLLTHTY